MSGSSTIYGTDPGMERLNRESTQKPVCTKCHMVQPCDCDD